MAKSKKYDNWRNQNKIVFFRSREKKSKTGLSLLSAFLFFFKKLLAKKAESRKENDNKRIWKREN